MSQELEVGHIGGATFENEKRDPSNLLSLQEVELDVLKLCLKLGPEALEQEVKRREQTELEYETADCGWLKMSEFCDCGEHTFHDYYTTKEPIRIDTAVKKVFDSTTIGEMLFPSFYDAQVRWTMKYRLPFWIIWVICYGTPRASAWLDGSFSESIMAIILLSQVIPTYHWQILKEVFKMPENVLFVLYVILWQVCISIFYRNVWHGKDYRGDYPWLIINGTTNALMHMQIVLLDAAPEKSFPIQYRFTFLLVISCYCLWIAGIYSSGQEYAWGYEEKINATDGEMEIKILDKTWLLTDMISSNWWIITFLVLKQFVQSLLHPDYFVVWTSKIYRKNTTVRPANWARKFCFAKGTDRVS